MINITALRDRSRLKKFQRGSVISDARNGTTVIFAVLKGDVCVTAGDETPTVKNTSMLGAGDLYIDNALLDGAGAAYTAIAASDAVVLPIDKSELYSFMHGEPELAGEIVRELTSRREAAALGRSGEECPSAPESAPARQEAAGFGLFPEGHGNHRLPVDTQNSACLMTKTLECPICGKSFQTQVVRASKLAVERTDDDMRVRYKGVEPLYYDVLTCPSCLFSALKDVFDKPERRRQDIRRELAEVTGGLETAYTALSGSDTVFARFYLALRCAPVCFMQHSYMTAKLLYLMSRLYQDAGNDEMESEMSSRALTALTGTYQSERLTPKQEQQVCVLIGELYLKQKDLKNSMNYFNKARTSGEKTGVLQRHAEDRIYDIRAMAEAR